MAEVGVGEPRERVAGGRDENAAGVAAREDVGPVEDHGGGATPEGVGDEAPPVLPKAGNRHEELARRDLPRVVGDAAERRRQHTEHRLVGQGVEEVGDRHGASDHGRTAGEASARRHSVPAGSGEPGGGAWLTTIPRPLTARRTSSGASTSRAWRSDSPWTFGMRMAASSPTVSGSAGGASAPRRAAVAASGAPVPISPRTRAMGAVLRGATLR